ncbi:purple acid phosphatase family protein [Fibrella forsythiae]|uniref:Metallophosphoesterase family protein n=1 Tax=Fibrella forsythiae TaxID=2817061 RepID=A0ABS3JNU9_9BACT|nr:metallophosphoesterase family protein [Fibrella forsythiae]MBO0951680.1 metallophosphoesterase family protein [Fibrella forsythiae]
MFRARIYLLISFLLLVIVPLAHAQQGPLVASGAIWRYADKGSTPTSQTVAGQVRTWKDLAYDDTSPASWSAGPSELGYGDGDEATVVSFGLDASAKHTTTYFRKTFTINSLSAGGYQVRVKRDDGLLLYLNGTLLATSNMPAGPVSYSTPATTGIGGTDESDWSAWIPVSASAVQAGQNCLAAEIHQAAPNSTDITFDLEFREVAISVTRGPYLQLGGQTAMTIRWRTDIACVGKVTYGLATSALTGTASETATTTEHEIRLTNLLPDQRYGYTIGTPNGVLRQGADLYLQTFPLLTTNRKIRVASFGDCGSATPNQIAVRDAFLAFRVNVPTDLWNLIGDNSYDGDDAAYQTHFFEYYKDNLLPNSTLYAIPGNHDYTNSAALAASHAIPYFSIFTLPTQAEAGGVPSGTREWYSFDYGPIHFVMLDGYGTRTVGGLQKKVYDDTLNHPQATWLKQDLAATNQPWRIVYLHFPPYTQGSHNSETEGDLTAIRQRLNPIFERNGVDLVISGHSHVYERSFPIHDQYGPMSEFTANPANYRYIADASTGRYDGSPGSCPYLKTSEKRKQGTIYVVSGSAGQLASNAALGNHAVMAFTQKQAGGSFYFDLEDNRLNASFIQTSPTASYTVTDQFTILKNAGRTRLISASAGQSVTLTASFNSDYQWSTPQSNTVISTARSLVVTATAGVSQTFTVRDSRRCVQDVFQVQTVYTTVKPGLWTDPATWEGNRLPTSQDNVIIKHAVLLPVNSQATVLRLQFGTAGTLTYGQNASLAVLRQ